MLESESSFGTYSIDVQYQLERENMFITLVLRFYWSFNY